MNRWHRLEGSPSPFGTTWIESERAYNFSIYSKHASGVVLLLYSEDDVVNPIYTHRLRYPANKRGRIWHCRLPASSTVQHMIAFRKAYPSLCRSRFWPDDVSWYGVGPQVDQSLQSRVFAFYLRGASQKDCDIHVMLNLSLDDAVFRIQVAGASFPWQRFARIDSQDIVFGSRRTYRWIFTGFPCRPNCDRL